MRTCLIALVLSCSPAVAIADQTPDIAYKIPYRLLDTKHIHVRVKLNNQGPFNFIIDTGAPALILTRETARKAKAAVDRNEWAKFDRFEIEGGLVVDKAVGKVHNMFQIEGMNGLGLAGCELHGVIGYNILARYKIEYDFTTDRMNWLPLKDFKPENPKGMGGNGGGAAFELETMGTIMKMIGNMMGVKPNLEQKARGFLGIELAEGNGVTVQRVLPDSPAAEAGLLAGDRIKEVRNREVETNDEFFKRMGKFTAGEKVRLLIERKGEEKIINVILGRGL